MRVSCPASPDSPEPVTIREELAPEWAYRIHIAEQIVALTTAGYTLAQAAAQLKISYAKAHRFIRAFKDGGREALRPGYDRCGRRPEFDLLEPEKAKLRELYLKLNLNEKAGSRFSAMKFLALDPATSDETRNYLLQWMARHSTVPGCIKRVLDHVTEAHVGQYRRPRVSGFSQFSGHRGARCDDKIARRRIIEADDGTLNFVVCIPWPMGGDPCSDKYGVRVCRAQWLPQIEAGWSHAVLGYSLVFRPRGSYRGDDVRECIYRVGRQYGLPDAYRFEHGVWESSRVVEILDRMDVHLDTVNEPNRKAIIEGFFSKAWTYLGVLPGQVGRYRGEHELENRLLEACKAGRDDPRKHFPMLADAIRGLDGTVEMHNSDTLRSVYGSWVPQVRLDQLADERPWRRWPAELDYLFLPTRREWTVAKGSVGGKIELFPDWSIPFYFANDELWRWNGHKLAVYFDHKAEECVATICATESAQGFSAGDVICTAPLIGELPSHARAAAGWAAPAGEYVPKWRNAAMAAVRRETRVFAGGRVVTAASEVSNGQGDLTRAVVELSPRSTGYGMGNPTGNPADSPETRCRALDVSGADEAATGGGRVRLTTASADRPNRSRGATRGSTPAPDRQEQISERLVVPAATEDVEELDAARPQAPTRYETEYL